MSNPQTKIELEEVYRHPEHGEVRVVELPEDDPKGAWVYPLDESDGREVNVARTALEPT